MKRKRIVNDLLKEARKAADYIGRYVTVGIGDMMVSEIASLMTQLANELEAATTPEPEASTKPQPPAKVPISATDRSSSRSLPS